MRLQNGHPFFLPEMPRFFNDSLTRNGQDRQSDAHISASNTSIPEVNILETNDGYIVEMAAPGMRKEHFEIQLDNNLLTISSRQENPHPPTEEGCWLYKEFSYQSFQRSFQLNQEVVDHSKITATYENGLLRLDIPKNEKSKVKPPRLITVS